MCKGFFFIQTIWTSLSRISIRALSIALWHGVVVIIKFKKKKQKKRNKRAGPKSLRSSNAIRGTLCKTERATIKVACNPADRTTGLIRRLLLIFSFCIFPRISPLPLEATVQLVVRRTPTHSDARARTAAQSVGTRVFDCPSKSRPSPPPRRKVAVFQTLSVRLFIVRHNVQ